MKDGIQVSGNGEDSICSECKNMSIETKNDNNEHKGKDILKYHYLSVNDDLDDISPYEDALDFALENDKITNFAVSGQFGAGKSSILRSYFKKHKISTINFSLTNFDFEDIGKVKKEDEYNSKKIEDSIEWKLLNQLVRQVKPKDTYLSDFQFKINPTKKMIKNAGIQVTIIIIVFYYYYNYNVLKYYVELMKSDIKPLFILLVNDYLLFFSVILSIYCIYKITSICFKYKYFGRILNRLKILHYEVEFKNNLDQSIFDKHLDEVVYLFRSSEGNIFVFEDIDRFFEYKVFERLREINSILNVGIDEKAKIKFIYLISDNIFKSKDRTKFFDFIIPIVPLVDSSNSYAHLENELSNIGVYDKNIFDIIFIRNISLYLDDMRLIKNICNEYKIYYEKIGDSVICKKKLLTMIIYKNLFPIDFEKSQHNEGLLSKIFKEKDEVFRVYESTITNIWLGKGDIKTTKYDVNVKDIYECVGNKFFDTESEENLKKILKIDNDYWNSIVNNPYLGFIKMVISYGYLDENFESYINIISRDILNENDKKYLHAINERTHLDYDQEINNFDLIMTFLNNERLNRVEVLNFDILKLSFEKSNIIGNENISNDIIKCASKNKKYEFIVGFFIKFKNDLQILNKISKVLFEFWHDFVYELIAIPSNELSERHQLTRLDIELFLSLWLQCEADFTSEFTSEFNTRIEALKNFIDESTVIFDFDIENLQEYERNLIDLGVKILKINPNKFNKNQLNIIYSNNMYVLSCHNLINIVKMYYFDKPKLNDNNFKMIENIDLANLLDIITSYKEKSLYTYVLANINDFVKILLEGNEISCNEIQYIEFINNEQIENEFKQELVLKYSGEITNIFSVKDKQLLWSLLITENKVKYNEENILAYFIHSNYTISDLFMKYIENSSGSKLRFKTVIENISECKVALIKMAESVCEIENFSLNRFRQIVLISYYKMSNLNNDIEIQKFEYLLRSNKIMMNTTNLNVIRQYFSNYKSVFIKKNFLNYLEIMTKSLLDESEVAEILQWREDAKYRITDKNKINLLKHAGKISLHNRNFSAKVECYIIDNHFDENDSSLIFTNYEYKDKDTQRAIIERAVKEIAYIISRKYSVSKVLLMDLIESKTYLDTPSRNIDIFCLLISHGNKKDLKKAIKFLGLNESNQFIEIIRNKSDVKISINSSNEIFLNSLKKKGIIKEYIIQNGNYLVL